MYPDSRCARNHSVTRAREHTSEPAPVKPLKRAPTACAQVMSVRTRSIASPALSPKLRPRCNAPLPEQPRTAVAPPKSPLAHSKSTTDRLLVSRLPCRSIRRLPLPCTWLSLGSYPACIRLPAGFERLWPGFHPSAFILHPSLLGSFGVGLGWLWLASAAFSALSR